MARSLSPRRRRWRRPLPAVVFLTAFACSTAAAQMPEERCGTEVSLMSWKGDLLHRPDSNQGVTVWHTGMGNIWKVECIGDGRFRLKSWKGDYLHRPDSQQGVTTWNTGIGNEWSLEFAGDQVRLKSWKGDYLHRPDSKQGLTTWHTGIGNEWTLMQGTLDSSGLGAGAPAMALLVTDTFADGQYLAAARSGGQAVLDIFSAQKRIVDEIAAAARRNAERADTAADVAKAYAFEAGMALTAGAVAGGASLWLAGGAGASALTAFATSGAVAGGVGVGVTAVGAAIAAPLVFASMESAVAVEVLNATDRTLRVARIVINHGRQTQGLKKGETLAGRKGGLTPGMIWSFEKNWGLQGIEACIHLEPTDGSWSGTAIWVRVPSTSDNRVGIAANAPDVQRTVLGPRSRIGGRKVTSSRCSITSLRPITDKASSYSDIRAHIGLSNHDGDFPRVIVHIGSTRAPAVHLDLGETAQGPLKYGDFVSLKGMATRWRGHDGYLSPCGNVGACGTGVTLRPDAEFTKHEPGSNLRRWQILGGETGRPVRYGDRVRLKATATRWSGHDGYLSPCGNTGGCGVGVTLRPDAEFTKHEPGSNLRLWRIEGGNGEVRSGATIRLKATATRWGGHDGYLSPCGNVGACGIGVTLRPDAEFTKHEPDSNLRNWTIRKL